MSSHKGITCDVCLSENFVGVRYKCLVCRNYDLCLTCYNEHRQSIQHTTDHPVQAILTQTDFEIFFGYEANRSDRQYQSFTCSYCGTMGFSNVQLRDHVLSEHSSSSSPVICPLCAVLDGVSINLVEGLSTHIALNHPELHESSAGGRTARHRTHYAPRHGVWMTMQSNSRRDFAGIPSEILSSRNREDLLAHLSTMRGGYIADELLTLEQFAEGNRRVTNLPYEHLLGNEDLRLFYDPLLVPGGTNDQSSAATSVSAMSTTSESVRTEPSNLGSSFLLTDLEENKTEEAKESWEMESADRSVFVQELFVCGIFEPNKDGNLCDSHDACIESVSQDASTIAESSVDDNQTSITNSTQHRAFVETTLNRLGVTQPSSSVIRIQDGRTVASVQRHVPSTPDIPEKAPSCDNML